MITVFSLSLLFVTIVAWWTVSRRRRTTQARLDNLPLLAVPAVPGHIARPRYNGPAVRQRVTVAPPSPVSAFRGGPSSPRAAAQHPVAPSASRATDRPASAETHAAAVVAANVAHEESGEAIDGASIRYWRAADGTLQFLPGRLELAAGRDAGQEIRFVRTAGPDGTTVTFGRADGAPYRHVQLREPTVSRAHARMCLEPIDPSQAAARTEPGGSPASHWHLENLSATNPVVVNGRALAADGGPRSSVILSDGDRVEMGEVAFIFRAR